MYRIVDKAECRKYRSDCSAVLKKVRFLLKERGISAQFALVGSGARNMVTRNGDGPFDLDYNLEIVNAPEEYRRDFSRQPFQVQIGPSSFSSQGSDLHIEQDGLSLLGTLRYGTFTALQSDIMGPFRFFAGMQCSHGIISMGHELHSKLEIKLIDCWNAYVDRLLILQPIEIIGKAAEITAARFCYDELTENTAAYPDHFLEHLLGFNDPLEVIREQWLEEQCGDHSGDHSGDLEHTLWSLWNHGPHPEEQSMDGMN